MNTLQRIGLGISIVGVFMAVVGGRYGEVAGDAWAKVCGIGIVAVLVGVLVFAVGRMGASKK